MASNEYSYSGTIYSFTDPVGHIFECPICQGVVNEARSVKCCKKTFCKSCIDEALKRYSTCPLCRSADTVAYENDAIDMLVNDLKVLCLHHGKGCEWSGHLLYEPQHREEKCDYEEVECENRGLLGLRCTVVCERRCMKRHMEEECKFRHVPCKYCSQLQLFVSMNWHVVTCPEHPFECANGCGEKGLLRRNIAGHLEVCPEAVVDCPFKEMGCSEDQLKRKDIQSHTTNAVSDHLALVMKSLVETKRHCEQAMQRQADTHKAQTDNLRAHIDQIQAEAVAHREETKALKACIKQLRTEVQTHNSKTEHQEAVGRAPSNPTVCVHGWYGWLLWLWYLWLG